MHCAEEHAASDEIVLPRRGAWIRRSSSGSVFADTTAILFFNAGDAYEIHHPLREPDSSTVFTPGSRLADELRQRRGECLPFPSGAIRASDGAARMHRVFLQALERRESCDPLTLEEAGLALLQLVVDPAEARRNPPRTGTSAGTHRGIAHDAAVFLNRRFRDHILLSDVAAAAGCSVFHLCRVFRDQTGHTINEHLTQLRLRAALGPVLASARAITDIAYDCGFSSHSHFAAAFRRRFAATPTELRATGRAGYTSPR